MAANETARGMAAVAERMLGRLDGRVTATATRFLGSGIGRAMERAEGDLWGGAAKASRSALLARLMEREEEQKPEVVSPFLDFSVRAASGAGSYSGENVVWLDGSELPPEELFEEEVEPQPGSAVLRSVPGWSSKPKVPPQKKKSQQRPVQRAFGRVSKPSPVAPARRMVAEPPKSRLLTVLDVLGALSPVERETISERLRDELVSVPQWAERSLAPAAREITASRRAESRVEQARGAPARQRVSRPARSAQGAGSRSPRRDIGMIRPPESGARSSDPDGAAAAGVVSTTSLRADADPGTLKGGALAEGLKVGSAGRGGATRGAEGRRSAERTPSGAFGAAVSVAGPRAWARIGAADLGAELEEGEASALEARAELSSIEGPLARTEARIAGRSSALGRLMEEPSETRLSVSPVSLGRGDRRVSRQTALEAVSLTAEREASAELDAPEAATEGGRVVRASRGGASEAAERRASGSTTRAAGASAGASGSAGGTSGSTAGGSRSSGRVPGRDVAAEGGTRGKALPAAERRAGAEESTSGAGQGDDVRGGRSRASRVGETANGGRAGGSADAESASAVGSRSDDPSVGLELTVRPGGRRTETQDDGSAAGVAALGEVRGGQRRTTGSASRRRGASVHAAARLGVGVPSPHGVVEAPLAALRPSVSRGAERAEVAGEDWVSPLGEGAAPSREGGASLLRGVGGSPVRGGSPIRGGGRGGVEGTVGGRADGGSSLERDERPLPAAAARGGERALATGPEAVVITGGTDAGSRELGVQEPEFAERPARSAERGGAAAAKSDRGGTTRAARPRGVPPVRSTWRAMERAGAQAPRASGPAAREIDVTDSGGVVVRSPRANAEPVQGEGAFGVPAAGRRWTEAGRRATEVGAEGGEAQRLGGALPAALRSDVVARSGGATAAPRAGANAPVGAGAGAAQREASGGLAGADPDLDGGADVAEPGRRSASARAAASERGTLGAALAARAEGAGVTGAGRGVELSPRRAERDAVELSAARAAGGAPGEARRSTLSAPEMALPVEQVEATDGGVDEMSAEATRVVSGRSSEGRSGTRRSAIDRAVERRQETAEQPSAHRPKLAASPVEHVRSPVTRREDGGTGSMGRGAARLEVGTSGLYVARRDGGALGLAQRRAATLAELIGRGLVSADAELSSTMLDELARRDEVGRPVTTRLPRSPVAEGVFAEPGTERAGDVGQDAEVAARTGAVASSAGGRRRVGGRGGAAGADSGEDRGQAASAVRTGRRRQVLSAPERAGDASSGATSQVRGVGESLVAGPEGRAERALGRSESGAWDGARGSVIRADGRVDRAELGRAEDDGAAPLKIVARVLGLGTRVLRIAGRDQVETLREVAAWRRAMLPEGVTLAGVRGGEDAEAVLDALVGGSRAAGGPRGTARAASRLRAGPEAGASAGAVDAASRASEAGGRGPRGAGRASQTLAAVMRGERAPTVGLAAASGGVETLFVDGSGAPSGWSGDVRARGDMAGYAGRRGAAEGSEAGGERPTRLDAPDIAWLADRPGEQLGSVTEVARAAARRGTWVGAPEGQASGEGRSAWAGAPGRRPTRRPVGVPDSERGDAARAAFVVGPEETFVGEDGSEDIHMLDEGARAPLSAGGASLLRALTRAQRPEQVLEVIGERDGDVAELAAALPDAAARVLRQVSDMRTLPESEVQTLSAPVISMGPGAVGVRQSGGGRGGPGSTTRRVRGAGGSAGSSATSIDGAGESKLMKLSQKLMSLIHLAEVERREDEAARQVRRSDEKVEAPSTSRAGQTEAEDGVTLAALQREVLDAVQRELEMMRERGEGGRHGDFWW